jgi:hypothetical protein
MSQKHPHRYHERAAQNRRKKQAELKRQRKEARLKAREAREKN